ncbi:hypothetical protein CROQUDRAFT_91918 [Cronartium quercuum f. sp. fusiforme G11]|uniref:Uncharacterized protein n=1 Tax=Cronartium quercuum f. sp. fusiforme G11 TaxID=708437 RepID=A0A9P6NK66_9BASI|nr:hypothetical protein CROQUDRAFT_91918 [Cronartium quercuum f. sp. fusiforme G11]
MNSWAATKLPGGLSVTGGDAVILRTLRDDHTAKYPQLRPGGSVVLTLPGLSQRGDVATYCGLHTAAHHIRARIDLTTEAEPRINTSDIPSKTNMQDGI